MSPRPSLLVLCTILSSACAQSLDERLDELDAQVTVDCGTVLRCSPAADAQAVVTCLRDNLAAGVGAKALFELGLDPVAHVYAIDGQLVSIEGYCYDECYFKEAICHEIVVSSGSSCATAYPTECEEPVREWDHD